jgi:hypothetical protein
LTNGSGQNIIASIRGSRTPGGRHQIGIPAGFKSESVAGFLLECVADIIGIRTGHCQTRLWTPDQRTGTG